jgi:TRAP-type C4-dicarboxylate transport system permease small subunit
VAALGRCIEDTLAVASLLAVALLPVTEFLLRAVFGTGIPGNAVYVANLTLWVGFVGAMIASREGNHLGMATGLARGVSKAGLDPSAIAATVSAVVSAGLAWSALQFVGSGVQAATLIDDWLPEWVILTILPLSFLVITGRFVMSMAGWSRRAMPLAAIIVGLVAAALPTPLPTIMLGAGVGLLLLAALLGAPVFVLLGGTALLLFSAEGVPVGAIMAEAYRMAVSPAIATLPLFTLAGYLLAEGGTTERLVRVFRAWFGWMPGGLAVVARRGLREDETRWRSGLPGVCEPW